MDGGADARITEAADRLEGLRILIVEDESMVAMLVEDLLGLLGCTTVGTAARVDEALRKVSALEFDAAILDVNLNGVKSYQVADALKAKGVPFVIATGYGPGGLPEQLRDVPVLSKPFQKKILERALGEAVRATSR